MDIYIYIILSQIYSFGGHFEYISLFHQTHPGMHVYLNFFVFTHIIGIQKNIMSLLSIPGDTSLWRLFQLFISQYLNVFVPFQ